MSNKVSEILSEIIDPKEVSVVNIDKVKYEWHTIASIEPLMSNSDYEMLLNDVKLVGSIHTPVVLYQGKIIDGRHRQKVAIELKKPLPTISISDSYKESDVSEAVRSLSMRRNKSTRQKEVQAFKYKQMVRAISYKDASSKYGVAERAVKRINTLFNKLRNAGFESDFDSVLTKLEYGLNVLPKDFVWVDRPSGSPYVLMQQLKTYEDRQQEVNDEDEIDITEVDPKTGETLSKADNAFITEAKDEIKYWKDKYCDLEKRFDELEKSIEIKFEEKFEKLMSKYVDVCDELNNYKGINL